MGSILQLRDDFTRFMLAYRFGLDEVMTKLTILRDEFNYAHSYNPIEHVGSRLKSPDSILQKAHRKGIPFTLEDIKAQMFDIAGVRVTCAFQSDIYRIRDLLVGQQDLTLLAERDYIAEPKPNGYKSLHLIVQVPVFMSDRVEPVTVEIQIRTIAMDFWASLEHKIYYKYDKEIPAELLTELKDAADVANALDIKMEHLHNTVLAIKGATTGDTSADMQGLIPSQQLLEAFLRESAPAPQTPDNTAGDEPDER